VRTGPSCAARGLSSLTTDQGVLRGQDFPLTVALPPDRCRKHQVKPEADLVLEDNAHLSQPSRWS
jgi:hypothetical protein